MIHTPHPILVLFASLVLIGGIIAMALSKDGGVWRSKGEGE